MAFELDFTANLADSCDQLQLCDTTGDFIPTEPSEVCNGYAVLDDGALSTVLRSEVISTKFNFIFPDGTKFTGIDVGFIPAQYAKVSMVLGGGTAGDGIIVTMDDVYLGEAIYISSLTDMIKSLVNSINSLSATTKWMAYSDGTTVYIMATSSDTFYNGQTLATYTTTGSTITATIAEPVTAGGNDGDNCITITLPDLYGQTVCPPGYPCWPVGVYTITYIIYDTNGVELARKQRKFLFDCQVVKCICAQANRLLECKPCQDKDGANRVYGLQKQLEAIYEEFETGNYECANEHIQDIFEKCKNLCLDC